MPGLFSNLNQRIALDLGSSYCRFWLDQEGLVLDQSSYLAVDQETGKVMAVGEQAKQMRGRVAAPVKVFQPVQQGQIVDDNLLKAMLKVFLQKASGQKHFFSPTVVVSLSTRASQITRMVLQQVLLELGARDVYLVDQPLAAAIGAGVPIADASGAFIFQLGAGVVEGVVLSLGKITNSVAAADLAGHAVDQQIKYYLHKQRQLKVGWEVVERVKQQLGAVELPNVRDQLQQEMLITGNDLASHSPQEIKLSSADIVGVFANLANDYERLLKDLLATIPPELTVDVIDKGLLLSGGLSQIKGLSEYLVNSLGVPVSVVDHPRLAVIKGLGTILEHWAEFKQSL